MSYYRHDLMFDALKRTTEQVSNNYTSSQYLKTLDFFIWNALTPIIESCPSLFLNYVAKIVAQQSVRNTKMTSDDKANLPLAFVNLLLSEDKPAAAQNLYLNRGILFAFLSLFESLTVTYKRLSETPAPEDLIKTIKRQAYTRRVEEGLGLVPKANLYGVILEVRYWTSKAVAFKNVIVEKYTRMALNNARRTYVDCQMQEPLGDIIGVFMLTLWKAIDRCDSRHGVLTTFIQNWFRGARSQVLEGIEQKHLNTSYEDKLESLGDASHEELGFEPEDTTYEAMQTLAFVAKKIDPRGCVRASLGIPELVTPRHRQLLLHLKA